MEIIEVPIPGLAKGQVLVRNHFSVISAGTEGKTVTDARKGYIAKAKSRRKEVRQVIDMIRSQGMREAYNVVMNKLEAPSPLGYSCAGEVIVTGEGVTDLKPGDLVACGGQGAYHADIVAVYRNLCVKLPKNADLQQAAFTTIAAIAIQGIRQAEAPFGSYVVVVGLGLIGQLTMKLLDATGINAIGVDVDKRQVELAASGFRKQPAVSSQPSKTYIKSSSPVFLDRNQDGIVSVIESATHGHGADAVIITAGTSSLDPVEYAGQVARQKGKVVVVGAVPTGFSRENYYKKELDLRMSSSYGPGRYDPDYEEKGIDYPAGYVRFTENRNMQSFVDLLSSGKIDISGLITHSFKLEDAIEAYDLILSRAESFTGMLIEYVHREEDQRSAVSSQTIPGRPSSRSFVPAVGFIGAGNFARNILLPRMKGLCNFVAIHALQGTESVYVAKKYGFKNVYDTPDRVINDPEVNTVFVLTRHDTHARFVMQALEAGKNVYVEKPLALKEEELEQIRSAISAQRSAVNHDDTEPELKPPALMLGFNRRFSPHVKKIKSIFLDSQPKAISMRINAGQLPPEHWVNDPETGGGRIVGEACHFVDLAMHLAGGKITSVYATVLEDPHHLHNTVNINLGFDNGSTASIGYYSNGNKNVPKEHIEVFCDGSIAIIDDFKKLHMFRFKTPSSRAGRQAKLKTRQDKGHRQEMIEFLSAIKEGGPAPIPFEDIYLSSLATFKVLESIRTGRKVELAV